MKSLIFTLEHFSHDNDHQHPGGDRQYRSFSQRIVTQPI